MSAVSWTQNGAAVYVLRLRVSNLADLEVELADCDEGVLRHHCPVRDFSRRAIVRSGGLIGD